MLEGGREVGEVIVPFSLLESTGYVGAHLWPVRSAVVLIRVGHHRDSAQIIAPPLSLFYLVELSLSNLSPMQTFQWMVSSIFHLLFHDSET